MKKTNESNRGSFLDEGFHREQLWLVPWHISISELNGGGQLKTPCMFVIHFEYLFVCRLPPNMVVLLFNKIAASCELGPGCGAVVPGGVHSL